MSKVFDFLKDAGTFYYATVEDNKPIMRPFGFLMEFEDKLYFGMGQHKNCFKQTIANPNVSICACNAKRQWIRISGTAVFDERPEAVANVFIAAPHMSNLYNEKTGQVIGIFYLKDAVAEIVVGQDKEVIKF
jgi:uncharacterized pyridoxamine 5'-phosphate oxidase family protein